MGQGNKIEESLIDPQNENEQPQKSQRMIFDGLTPKVYWGYSVGHVFNDLCASAWFNFLLFYFSKVLKFENSSYSMLFGQIFDALGTPSAGILSDKYNTRIGKRIPWYILSYIFVLLTFVPMWCYPILNTFLPMDNDNFRNFFYIFFPSIFNFTWAFGYIAHISLVPSMTCSRVNRDTLNARRNTFTFIAQMLLLLIALLLFQIIDTSEQQFQALGLIVAVIGSVCTVIFLLTVKEVPLTKACDEAVKNIKHVLKLREGDKRQSLLLEDGGKTKQEKINQASSHHESEQSVVLNSKTKEVIENQIKGSQENKMKSEEENDQIDTSQVEEAEVFDKYGNKIDDVIFNKDQQEGYNKFEDDEEDENQQNNGQVKVKASVLRGSRVGSLSESIVNWKQWFKEKQFYQYGLVFMLARLFCNVVTTMMNFYLYYVIQINGEVQEDDEVKMTFSLALVPLLLYISSVGASSILNLLYQKIGRKKTYTLGVVLMLASLIPMGFLQADNSFLKNLIYPLALVVGAAQALQLNTAINLISEVIGLRGAGGAFVFGAYSFLDKLMTGIVLFAITESSYYKNNNPTFIRLVTVVIPCASGLLAWILILFGQAKDYDPKNKNARISRMSLGDEFVQ
ncbi:MFS transporter (macronuclear) [Tetrahymena thermophila SB210]|uniref:MFS transporter n=1 Tax=Tetrahymena thermophila (strain SB210) TaxID=312017 RepID=Q245X7_TETTS|nr:MFS transporter [Tetrahymena thermophila SB210]EAS03506.1 MFS transporter [Tetrahymena thermophila SB210]|eukprot:XP_001023751.1 MFS transporter [Tetrahymena thermophila SB210]